MENSKRSIGFVSLYSFLMVIALIFVGLFCNSCPGQDLRITWTYPKTTAPEDSIFFKVLVWQGDSTAMTNFSPADMDSVGRRDFVSGLGEYQFPYYFNPTSVIRAGLQAEDRLGRVTDTTYTKFYGYPSRPENLRIEK